MDSDVNAIGALWMSQFWFWVAAGLIWMRGFAGALGVSRRLIRDAAKETEAARFAFALARFRLGRGRVLPLGLAPFRWPLLGAALAYAVWSAQADALALDSPPWGWGKRSARPRSSPRRPQTQPLQTAAK